MFGFFDDVNSIMGINDYGLSKFGRTFSVYSDKHNTILNGGLAVSFR